MVDSSCGMRCRAAVAPLTSSRLQTICLENQRDQPPLLYVIGVLDDNLFGVTGIVVFNAVEKQFVGWSGSQDNTTYH